MNTDGELESWRRQWQSRSEPGAEADSVERLRRRVLRETRWIKLSLIAPILVTVVSRR